MTESKKRFEDYKLLSLSHFIHLLTLTRTNGYLNLHMATQVRVRFSPTFRGPHDAPESIDRLKPLLLLMLKSSTKKGEKKLCTVYMAQL